MNADERLLAEIESMRPDGTILDPHQLDFFGTLLSDPQGMRRRSHELHRVAMADGTMYVGTWDDILLQMKQDDREWAGSPIQDYMNAMARRRSADTGIRVPTTDAESFIRAFDAAGLLRITS